MAWGYERGFCIEHLDRNEHKVTCRDCEHYDDSDKSCMKRPVFLPHDGFNLWKKCEFFTLERNVPYYEEKCAKLGINYVKQCKKQINKSKNYGLDVAKYKTEKVNRNSGFGNMELPFADYKIRVFGAHHHGASVKNCVFTSFLLQNGTKLKVRVDHKAKIVWISETDMQRYGTMINDRVKMRNKG